MRENDEITGLFRNRLADAKMTVQEGFWEKLQNDLPSTSGIKDHTIFSPKLYRWAAAASVVLVLGVASAAFWCFFPKTEIQEAFTQVAAMTPEGSLKGDVVHENFPSIHETSPTVNKQGMRYPASGMSAGVTAPMRDEESVSVRVSITFTQRVYSNQSHENGFFTNRNVAQNNAYSTSTNHVNAESERNPAVVSKHKKVKNKEASLKRDWALKLALGTSLPADNFNMPFMVGVSVERRLNELFSLEGGLQYNYLSDEMSLHTLGIPVKLNALLASSSKVDFYATVGGMVEKCIAGTSNNGFGAEPMQLSVTAGLGVRYKMNDRFALFVEPSVSHHFDTDSRTRTLRNARPTNLNLVCGLRMTY